MTYFDYFLRGADRAELIEVLLAAGLVLEEGGEHLTAAGVNLAEIGRIIEGGRWDDDGNEVEPPIEIPGWHANLRMDRALTPDEAEQLQPILIDPPATPFAVWA